MINCGSPCKLGTQSLPVFNKFDFCVFKNVRAHHKNQRVVESNKISNDFKNSINRLSLIRNTFPHENYLSNLSFEGRRNLNKIPTSQNNVEKDFLS